MTSPIPIHEINRDNSYQINLTKLFFLLILLFVSNIFLQSFVIAPILIIIDSYDEAKKQLKKYWTKATKKVQRDWNISVSYWFRYQTSAYLLCPDRQTLLRNLSMSGYKNKLSSTNLVKNYYKGDNSSCLVHQLQFWYSIK